VDFYAAGLGRDHSGAGSRAEPGFEDFVPHPFEAGSIVAEQTSVQKLAQLFPAVSAVRLPVRVISMGAGKTRLEENAVIEFGTPQEVLFASNLPLEFEDRVRVVNSDGSFDAIAAVIAVRYDDGRRAVAVRFIGQVQNWIIKP
jgi:hypothetical protein